MLPDLPPLFVALCLCASAARCTVIGEPLVILVCLYLSAGAHAALAVSRRKARMGPWVRLVHAVGFLGQDLWRAGLHHHHLPFPDRPCHRNGWLSATMGLMIAHCSQGYASCIIPWLPVRAAIGELHVLSRIYVGLEGDTHPWVLAILHHVTGLIIPLLFFSGAQKAPLLRPAAQNDQDKACTTATPSSETCDCKLHLSTQCAGRKPAIPSPAYQSVMGECFHISIKINTHHHPEDLAPDTLNHLTRLIEERSVLPHRRGDTVVLSAAVLRGCILLSLDLCMLPHPDRGSGPVGTRGAVPEDQVLACAQRLLPAVLTELGLSSGSCSKCLTDSAGSDGNEEGLLEPGQYLQLQLGGHTVQASIDSKSSLWLFRVLPMPAAVVANSDVPAMCLAWPEAAVAPEPGTVGPGTHTVTFTAVIAQCSSIQIPVMGADPARGLLHDADKPSLQVWVRCQGQYFRTVVTSCDSSTGRIRASTELPDTALTSHHQPAGPIARLQVLHVELWHSSQALLSSAPLLVDTARHMQPPVQSGSFGWWGLSASAAAGVVFELCDRTARVADVATPAAQASHEAFVADLAVWLGSVQQAAPGTCCDMLESTRAPPASCLQLTQRAVLAASLHQHAVAWNLPRMAAAIAAQQRLTLPLRQQPRSISDSARRAAVTAGVVRSCTACDQLYYKRLKVWLQPVCLLVVAVFAASYLIALWQPPSRADIIHTVVAVTGFLLVTTLQLVSYRDVHIPTATTCPGRLLSSLGRWLLQQGGISLVAYSLHVVFELCILGGLQLVKPEQCTVATMGPLMTTHTLFMLLAQILHLWGHLPNWLLRGMLAAEAVGHLHIAHTCPSMPRWLSRHFMVGGTLVIPWLLDQYWRRLLRPNRARA